MATRQFADLSAYRRNVNNAQAGANLLDSLIQGVQGGIQLQQLPGKLQENQIAQQLQNAINLQKLQDLQNPQAALARRLEQELTLKGALNSDLGIVRAQPGLVGQTITTPGALTAQQMASLPTQDQMENQATAAQIALSSGQPVPEQLSLPSVAPGLPETPISAFGIQTGLNVNPNIPIQAKDRKLNDQIAAMNARAASSGTPIRYERGLNDELIAVPTRQVGTGPISTIPIQDPTGEAPKLAPRASTRSGGAARALTPNAQTTLLSQASAAGIDPDSPKYFDEATNTYDFIKLSIDKGKAQRENKRAENAAKASELKGKTKTDVDALNAADKQLDFLQDEIAEIANSGKTPGFLDNLIAAETSSPPTGWLSSGWQQLLKDVQSEESKELEGKKTIISSALTKAISGLAVTAQEATRLGFLPRAGESFQEIVRKAAVLKEYIKNQREGLSGVPDEIPVSPATPAPAAKGTKIGRFTLIDTR